MSSLNTTSDWFGSLMSLAQSSESLDEGMLINGVFSLGGSSGGGVVSGGALAPLDLVCLQHSDNELMQLIPQKSYKLLLHTS